MSQSSSGLLCTCIKASGTRAQDAVIRPPWIIKQMCVEMLWNIAIFLHVIFQIWDNCMALCKRWKKNHQSFCGPDVSLSEGFRMHEVLIKLLKKVQRWIKHFIIHAHDLSLIKMKWGCDFIMAASPKNRSDFLLWSTPEGCVHSSEQLLGSDETVLFKGLRKARSGRSGSHSVGSYCCYKLK